MEFRGLNTSAIIRIINLEHAAGGNDFGLDDISFGTLAAVPFSELIQVLPGANRLYVKGRLLL